jgi:hypothetical protein
MTELNLETMDTSDLDDPYMHATCTNIQPVGSVQQGRMYKTLCGKEVLYRGASEKCPKCAELFSTYPCPMCGKSLEGHM